VSAKRAEHDPEETDLELVNGTGDDTGAGDEKVRTGDELVTDADRLQCKSLVSCVLSRCDASSESHLEFTDAADGRADGATIELFRVSLDAF
jgi:hypothetical protein